MMSQPILQSAVTNDLSHSASFLAEPTDHEFLILFSPFARTCVGFDEELDVIVDVVYLATLIMKGYRMRCQRLENDLNIRLWTAGNAKM